MTLEEMKKAYLTIRDVENGFSSNDAIADSLPKSLKFLGEIVGGFIMNQSLLETQKIEIENKLILFKEKSPISFTQEVRDLLTAEVQKDLFFAYNEYGNEMIKFMLRTYDSMI